MREFYIQRIAACDAEQAGTDLPLVRERAARSRTAWEGMLAREVVAEKTRARKPGPG